MTWIDRRNSLAFLIMIKQPLKCCVSRMNCLDPAPLPHYNAEHALRYITARKLEEKAFSDKINFPIITNFFTINNITWTQKSFYWEKYCIFRISTIHFGTNEDSLESGFKFSILEQSSVLPLYCIFIFMRPTWIFEPSSRVISCAKSMCFFCIIKISNLYD